MFIKLLWLYGLLALGVWFLVGALSFFVSSEPSTVTMLQDIEMLIAAIACTVVAATGKYVLEDSESQPESEEEPNQ